MVQQNLVKTEANCRKLTDLQRMWHSFKKRFWTLFGVCSNVHVFPISCLVHMGKRHLNMNQIQLDPVLVAFLRISWPLDALATLFSPLAPDSAPTT